VCSPDLAPSDFHLFPKLKEQLQSQRFSCDKEVVCSEKVISKTKQRFLKGGFKQN
jgi:hypothetical protein